MDSTASIPNTPTLFFKSPAPASTVSAASDRMPPTTGTMPETANLAAFIATASAEPAITPLTVR